MSGMRTQLPFCRIQMKWFRFLVVARCQRLKIIGQRAKIRLWLTNIEEDKEVGWFMAYQVYSSLHCFITAKLPVTIWMQRRHHSTICFGFHEAPSPLSGMFRSVTAFLVQPHRWANDTPLGTLSRLSETKFKTFSSSAVRLKTFISNHCTAKSVYLA